MSTVLALLLVFAAAWFVWRFISALFHPRQPSDPVDGPFALVPEPWKKPPRGKSGAIALEEPDEERPPDCFPPREI